MVTTLCAVSQICPKAKQYCPGVLFIIQKEHSGEGVLLNPYLTNSSSPLIHSSHTLQYFFYGQVTCCGGYDLKQTCVATFVLTLFCYITLFLPHT